MYPNSQLANARKGLTSKSVCRVHAALKMQKPVVNTKKFVSSEYGSSNQNGVLEKVQGTKKLARLRHRPTPWEHLPKQVIRKGTQTQRPSRYIAHIILGPDLQTGISI